MTSENQAATSMDENARQRIIQQEILAFLSKELSRGSLESPPPPPKKKIASAASTKPKKTRKQRESQTGKESRAMKKAKRREKNNKNLCKEGEIIGGRFRIVAKFKQGGFGQIYKAVDMENRTEVAIKVELVYEFYDVVEDHVLAKLQTKSHCPIMYANGSSDTYVYIVMQLLGENLSEARRKCRVEPRRLSMSASVRVAVQCLEALENLHGIGYLHRDVKPSNFAVGRWKNDRTTVYMLDFGLCRYFLTASGQVKPERPKIGFRGTVRYASLRAHEFKELARRDDLWSLFYAFYELMIGCLQWRDTNDKEIVGKLKNHFTPEVMCRCRNLPKEIVEFVHLIRILRYEDKPAYEDMYDVLNGILQRINVGPTDLFDWQLKDCKELYHWPVPN